MTTPRKLRLFAAGFLCNAALVLAAFAFMQRDSGAALSIAFVGSASAMLLARGWRGV
jgi:preprotein translocase subunit SecG